MKSFIDQGGRKLNIGGDIQVNNINYCDSYKYYNF